MFLHYIRLCKKFGQEPSYEHCRSIWDLDIYSDDIIGGCDDPRWVDEQSLRETFALAGFDVKDYLLTEDITQLTFLGAKVAIWNFKGKNFYVPKYDTGRMLYALIVNGGRVSNRLRAERVSGLAHNLAFSPFAQSVEYLATQLKQKGLWPSDIPIPRMEVIRREIAMESR